MASLFRSLLACTAPWLAVAAQPVAAQFESFTYIGMDPVQELPKRLDHYRNPILPGFYPDPSICRVGEDYYLVNSTFAYFPGIPIFHSRDLVHWRQLGHVLDRSSQLKLDGHRVSRGNFAPTIHHHAGLFYVIGTVVDTFGNFYVTAENPAGPWSEPILLPEIDGIDPSFFFDDDGHVYVINNGPPPENKPLYDGHRAIWIQEFDLKQGKLIGPRRIIINGGVDLTKKPVWIEGPHIFRKDGWYYLCCAEGGTAEDHTQVIFRSRSVWEGWEPWSGNPILTQRLLPEDRLDPVTCTGHADLVEGTDGTWWAVFLGCRPYGENYTNIGRETFLLPVTWSKDGWPMILPSDRPVPLQVEKPRFGKDWSVGKTFMPSGNFADHDSFETKTLPMTWISLRGPYSAFASLESEPGVLSLLPREDRLDGLGKPSFVARRQQHSTFDAKTTLRLPVPAGSSAGLVSFQNETHHYYAGVRTLPEGKTELFVECAKGASPEVLVRTQIPSATAVSLKVTTAGAKTSFLYSLGEEEWKPLLVDADATLLSTRKAGGFVGAVVGLHSRLEKQP